MAFLRINGWTIPVENESASRGTSEFGRRMQTQNGRARFERRRIKHNRSFTSPCLSLENADTLEGLIAGEGHRWSFDSDAWSDDGIGPEAGLVVSYLSTGSKFGSGHLGSTSVTFDLRRFPNDRFAEWTAIAWVRIATVWYRRTIRSDGAQWEDGVRDDTIDNSWLTVSDGGFSLGVVEIDDLAFLRFRASDSFVTESYAWQNTESRPFSSMPFLEVDGDVISGRRQNMLGRVQEAEGIQYGGAGGWVNNARNVPFELVAHTDEETIP